MQTLIKMLHLFTLNFCLFWRHLLSHICKLFVILLLLAFDSITASFFSFHSARWCNWCHKSHPETLEMALVIVNDTRAGHSRVTLKSDTREWHQRVTLERTLESTPESTQRALRDHVGADHHHSVNATKSNSRNSHNWRYNKNKLFKSSSMKMWWYKGLNALG